MPDMPGSWFSVVRGGSTYDLDADYDPVAHKKLCGVIFQLMNDGKKRLAEVKNGSPPPSGSVQCPEKTKQ
jgi:hypothetical protein